MIVVTRGVIQRGFRYRLYPTAEQAELLQQTAGVVRLVYNLAWEQRRDWWRQYKSITGRDLTYVTQGHQVTELRREYPFIGEVHSTPLTQALRDLNTAFRNFFAGRSAYPRPRKRGMHDSFRYRAVDVSLRRLNAKWSAVRLPKIGWIKFRDTRQINGRLVNVTVTREPLGWHVALASEIENEANPSNLPAIGIDRGVTNTLALSNGEMLSLTSLKHLEGKKRRHQKTLARRQRGSNRYRQQRRRLSRIANKIKRCRADWCHKVTTDIALRFGTVSLEALNIQNMSRAGSCAAKRGLNRSIREQGWGHFERLLTYKLEERGGQLVKVNPAYTSQECSACGVIDKASRKSQSRFACQHCGHEAHADTNAAMNIQRRSTALLRVKEAGHGSVEARTINHAAVAA